MSSEVLAPPVRFGVASDFDFDLVRERYRRTGWAQIPQVLSEESASEIHRCLVEEVPWYATLNIGKTVRRFAKQEFDALDDAARAKILNVLHSSATDRFQYFFWSFPLGDLYRREDVASLYAMRVHEFLSSEAFLSFARRVTGADDIVGVTTQAALYEAGSFLTQHNDNVPDEGRVAAYVFNFTRDWKADWGGILELLNGTGETIGLLPAFNALNIFRVPRDHIVSYVAPYATHGRYTIHGWLLNKKQLDGAAELV